jgi:hypothetical protein
MTPRENGPVWHRWLVVAATLLSVAACGGTTASSAPGPATPTGPSPSPSVTASLPSFSPSASTPPSSAAIAASESACGLISAGDAAAALGSAVGKGLPVPPVNLHNGAVGGTCEWTDSAGGTVLVITLKYPSPAIARKVFNNSKSSTANTQPVRLPDLAPVEFGDTGTYGPTRIAESFLLDGIRELNVTINEPASGPGSRFSLPTFVTLVQRAARAWR